MTMTADALDLAEVSISVDEIGAKLDALLAIVRRLEPLLAILENPPPMFAAMMPGLMRPE